MTDWTPCPDILADDGYPSDAELETIRTWPVNCGADLTALFAYIEMRWAYRDWGWHRESRRRRKFGRLRRIYRISTAGWSGNESIIDALERNWWAWSLAWRLSRRGGHFEFEIDEEMT